MKLKMFFRWLFVLSVVPAFIGTGNTATAQQDCSKTLPPRLLAGQPGQVLRVDGQPLNVRNNANRTAAVVGQIPEGARFDVLEGPACADGVYWWRIKVDSITGWVAEGDNGKYFVGPLSSNGTAAATPKATAIPSPKMPSFAKWDWKSMDIEAPDPMALKLPAVYAGKLPTLPINLDRVLFVKESSLSVAQLALLKQNGFVVVPAGLPQFNSAYSDGNDLMYPPGAEPGAKDAIARPKFVTTDSMLWALHYIFDNLLTDLEKEVFIREMRSVVASSYQAAQQQAKDAAGTSLEKPAQNASVYLAVAQKLFGASLGNVGFQDLQNPDVEHLVQLAMQANGRERISFLGDYVEDFSQYRPRGHYAGDAVLEEYFRGMMWLSRITLKADSDDTTLMALLLMRALRKGNYVAWQKVHETLTFLIGPVDDLGPPDYGPVADKIFGADLNLTALQDPARLASFRAEVAKLPGPRVNGLTLPSNTQAKDIANRGLGFRLMGQRFTFDAYVMQQLMYPYVGDERNQRALPLSLDIASVMGSETASGLTKQAGAAEYANYETQMQKLRTELGQLSTDRWLENIYGSWFWTLQPMWKRDIKPYPPLMQTDAWLRKDLQTGLASWTTLKHDTVLYVKQPTGFGGGGPPLYQFGYVEPNPLVFARISVVASLTYQGLNARELGGQPGSSGALITDMGELRKLAEHSARFAEAARKELAGVPLGEQDYWDIQSIDEYLYVLLNTLYQGESQPKPVALITDVATNTTTNQILLEGVGGVDFIYVVIPGPKGMQLSRGAVFSYYEFLGDSNQRPTDDEWRRQVFSRKLPPRPEWVKSFLSGPEPSPIDLPK